MKTIKDLIKKINLDGVEVKQVTPEEKEALLQTHAETHSGTFKEFDGDPVPVNKDKIKKINLDGVEVKQVTPEEREALLQTHAQTHSGTFKEFDGDPVPVNGNGNSAGNYHHTPVEKYFKLNNFGVVFSEPFIVPEKYITSISKPVCDIISGVFVENKITMTFQYVKESHFFGRPSLFNNMFLDSEIWIALSELNKLGIEYIKVEEYDEEGNPKIETKYYNPVFRTLTCAPNDNNDSSIKYFTVEISFDKSEQEYCEILEETEE